MEFFFYDDKFFVAIELARFIPPFWVILAIMTPFLNAMVNVIDVYFAGGVYENEWDGAAISCLYKIVAVPAVFFWLWKEEADQNLFQQILVIESELIFLAFLAGILYSLSSLFYFRAIMTEEKSDVVFVESIFNLTAVVVPILSVFLLGKFINLFQWFGIFLAVFGAFVLVVWGQDFSGFTFRDNRLVSMGLAVVSLSLAMIIEDKVYATASFAPVFAIFSLGCFSAGCVFALVRVYKKMENLFIYVKRFWPVFVAMETLELSAVFFHEKTISLTDSHNLSTIYCSQPIFALLISYFLLLFPFFWNRGLSDWARYHLAWFEKAKFFCELTEKVGEDQRGYVPAKIIGTIAIVLAVLLISF